jgi:hypothetical protein
LNALDRSGGVYDSSKDNAYALDRALEGTFLGVGAALAATGTARWLSRALS